MPSGSTRASDAARNAATERKLARFLVAFRRIGAVKKACRAVGLSSWVAYDRRKSDPEFARQWDAIVEAQLDEVEASLYQQAIGIEVPVMHNGVKVGTRIVVSDRAAIFMLRTRRPEKYGDPPYPHHRGCTVGGYRRDGMRGAIVERDAPTSVQVVAEPETAALAIEAVNAFATDTARLASEPPCDEMHLVATDAPHGTPDAEVLPPASEPDARPHPQVVVRVAVRHGTPSLGRSAFGWPVTRRDDD